MTESNVVDDKPFPRTIGELESSPGAMKRQHDAALKAIAELEAEIGIDQEAFELGQKLFAEDSQDLS